MKYRATAGTRSDAGRAPRNYRGSRRRFRRIKLRDNTSVALWLLVAWVIFLLLVVVPWMIRQNQ